MVPPAVRSTTRCSSRQLCGPGRETSFLAMVLSGKAPTIGSLLKSARIIRPARCECTSDRDVPKCGRRAGGGPTLFDWTAFDEEKIAIEPAWRAARVL